MWKFNLAQSMSSLGFTLANDGGGAAAPNKRMLTDKRHQPLGSKRRRAAHLPPMHDEVKQLWDRFLQAAVAKVVVLVVGTLGDRVVLNRRGSWWVVGGEGAESSYSATNGAVVLSFFLDLLTSFCPVLSCMLLSLWSMMQVVPESKQYLELLDFEKQLDGLMVGYCPSSIPVSPCLAHTIPPPATRVVELRPTIPTTGPGSFVWLQARKQVEYAHALKADPIKVKRCARCLSHSSSSSSV
jgi:hypothetical protein